MDLKSMLANLLRKRGEQDVQQDESQAAKGTFGQSGGSTANVVNANTRQAWMKYAQDAQEQGNPVIPYAQWAAQQGAK